MLVLSRREGETLVLSPAEGIPLDMTVADLLAAGPLRVRLVKIRGNQARLGVEAPQALTVARAELVRDAKS